MIEVELTRHFALPVFVQLPRIGIHLLEQKSEVVGKCVDEDGAADHRDVLGGIVVWEILQPFLLFRLVLFVLRLDQLNELEEIVLADKRFLHGEVLPLLPDVKDVETEFEEIRHLDLFALNLDVDRLDENVEKHLGELGRIEFLLSQKLCLELSHNPVRDQFLIPLTQMLAHYALGDSERIQNLFGRLRICLLDILLLCFRFMARFLIVVRAFVSVGLLEQAFLVFFAQYIQAIE